MSIDVSKPGECIVSNNPEDFGFLTINQSEIAHFYGIYIRGNVPVLIIEAPCGTRVEYFDWADIPREDVSCPCGNPNHWIIKYDRIKENK